MNTIIIFFFDWVIFIGKCCYIWLEIKVSDAQLDYSMKCYTERAVDKHPKIW